MNSKVDPTPEEEEAWEALEKKLQPKIRPTQYPWYMPVHRADYLRGYPTTEIRGQWVLSRPERVSGFIGLKGRILAAWYVLRGRMDAIVFTEE